MLLGGRKWVLDLRDKMTKNQKDELRYKSDESIRMVNKYVDADGVTRVCWPQLLWLVFVFVVVVVLNVWNM